MHKRMVEVREFDNEEYDVVVAGGGMTGVCASVAAAREGAKVILLEATGALGGMATMGMVPCWCWAHDGERMITSGLSTQLVRSASPQVDEPQGFSGTRPFPKIEVELLKRLCDELVLSSGGKLLFNTTVAGVEKNGERLEAVYIANKSGITSVRGKVFVDCTGDADLAAWAGVEYEKGDEDGDMQPVTHCYAVCGVDTEKLREEHKSRPDWKTEFINDPEFPLILDSYIGVAGGSGFSVSNGGHLWAVDNTEPENITQALVNGRSLAEQIFRANRKYFPQAYEHAELVCTAPLMGVRETRRIKGDYVLTRADYDCRRRFDDEIAFSCFYIDIHPSLKKRELERQNKWNWIKEIKDSKYGVGEFHAIPYRSLLPVGIENLLVAGRSISTDREANSAMRVMPVCMSLGEAAGIAAAKAGKDHGGAVRKVDVTGVQRRIRETGGFMPAESCVASSVAG